jgi:dihydrofolate reductase
MGKIIMSIPITLDGFIDGPHRELDWVVADDELHNYYTQLLNHAVMMLYGRVTYQLMASYWPRATTDTTIPDSMLRIAKALDPMRKVVFSKTLNKVGWNTQVKKLLIPEEIKKMKAEANGDILLSGGAAITQAFIAQGLVDEFQLVVQPVAIGEGKSLFGGFRDMLKLNFQWSRPFTSGAVALCYHLDGKM